MRRILPLVLVLLVSACGHNKPVQTDTTQPSSIEFPVFNADSAFAFVKAQTDFGPRVPNTEAHAQCAQ